MRRLIIFLVRKRLGLKKYQYFRFANQKTDDIYYFTGTALIKKAEHKSPFGSIWCDEFSGVSLNWLLNKDCKIRKETSLRDFT